MGKIGFLKNAVFDENQFGRVSNIFDNAGQVVLGIAVLSPVIVGFAEVNKFVIISGIVVTIFCWLVSIWLARKGN